MAAGDSINWPFGDADKQTPAHAAVQPVTVIDQLTILAPATMSADITVNLTIDSNVKQGAMLMLIVKSDGTARQVTLGTGFTGLAIAGVISKTKVALFMYDGTTFKPVALAVQID